jgi:ABC-type sugar transport system ATPase subunit
MESLAPPRTLPYHMTIELDNLSIRSGPFTLSGISLQIPRGAYAVLMGGTGQGKTTILEAICGLRTVTSGRVILGGVDMTRFKPADRGVGYLPQDLGLFPTMTVRGHLEFALRVRKTPRPIINDRVAELSKLLGIEPLLARHVQKLSGGEAQRVALGRALAFRPQVLLFDEPLNALDETTRDRLCELLRKVQQQTGVTTLHITHTRAEARALADKLIILKEGRLEERPLSDLDRLPAEVVQSPITHSAHPLTSDL